ncbi:MAG: Ppx/GppA family phosphatase [Parvularculaceae bacterium]|nr:Ppx/GppA family phosphatase [Parvularculaceae bacterium]
MVGQAARSAVVDIGSNSVRLVIFSGTPRVPVTITNEKALCGLGDRDPETGNLRPEAIERALSTLKRFVHVLDQEQPATLEVFATAAVRDAPNGRSFLRAIDAIGLRPRLISGEEEARLAGLGILCSAPEIMRDNLAAVGGDLGGGSLELSLLGGPEAEVDNMISLPIGSLRLYTQFADDRQTAAQYLDEQFAQADWLAGLEQTHLYIVGGAWRAIARVGMWLAEHPLSILDHYSMSADQARDVCRFVEEASEEQLFKIKGVQKKRVPTLPMAAMALRKLIDKSSAEKVVVSSCGVREGLLFDRLPLRIRREEPLFSLAKDLAKSHTGGRLPSVDAVMKFVDPLFQDDAAMRRLRQAAAMMIRVANTSHPDERANHAAAIIMSGAFVGIDHVERAILATMVKCRFGGSVGKSDAIVPTSVMSEEQMDYALRVGRAHRLAASLRSPLYRQRSGFTLSVSTEAVQLRVSDSVKDVVVEQALKDLSRLADAFGLAYEITS